MKFQYDKAYYKLCEQISILWAVLKVRTVSIESNISLEHNY